MFKGPTMTYSPITFGTALKYFMDGAAEFGADWKALVLTEYPAQKRYAYDQAVVEIPIKLIKALKRNECLIELCVGATMRFYSEEQFEAMRGMHFTQAMWLYRPRSKEIRTRMSAVLRSQVVDDSCIRQDDVII